jgi:oxaloacetate decarboxylase gamma subunit
MNALFEQGVELMLLGMGLVFSFLIALVVATTVMSRLVNRFFPESEAPAAVPAPAPAGSAEPVSPRTAAIIREAIAQHRARRGRDR